MAGTNVYQMVTDRIIAQLEQGIIPWNKPWTGVRGGAYNRISKKAYSLINQMMLRHDGEYATYKQWQDIGGQVRKGEKAEQVVFCSVAFHEATHSTMKETRCNRPQKMAAFGSESYSKEELVAEIGSATLLNIIGIETPGTFKNNAAYIQNWLQVLRNDNRFVISASSKAEKAVRYILNDNTTEWAA